MVPAAAGRRPAAPRRLAGNAIGTMGIRQKLDEALALQKRGDWQQAATIYSAILETNADCADAWHLLGLVDFERRDHAAGVEKVNRALGLKPRNPVYHHNLATLLGDRGDLAAAEEHYREAIRLKPDYDEAVYNLSAVIKLRAHDPILDRIAARLKTVGLSKESRVFLHFAAGKLWDDLGDHKRAFHHYAAGNRAKEKRFNREAASRGLAAMKDTFTRAFFERRHGGGRPDERFVFVVGMPRSGTSLIEQILASHSQVHGGGEMPDIPAISRRLRHYHPEDRDYPGALTDMPDRVIDGLARAYAARMEEVAGPAPRVVDKLPLNFWHLGLIALLLPQARIIHARRDPRDTCLSCFFQNFQTAQSYAFDLADLGFFHGIYRDLMAHWSETLPLPLLEVAYEDLVADPEAMSRKLVAFCGLDWEPQCLAFHETKREVTTASRWQVRQPIYRSSIGRWKPYEPYIGPLLKAL